MSEQKIIPADQIDHSDWQVGDLVLLEVTAIDPPDPVYFISVEASDPDGGWIKGKDIRGRVAKPEPERRAKVELYRPSGKWYGDAEWRIPADATGPRDMERSPDRNGYYSSWTVLVPTQEPWGYPCLLLPGGS